MTITYMVALFGILFLHVLALGIHLAKDGDAREEEYNFVRSLINFVIIMILYYAVGVFDPMFSQ